jgi:Zn/Cd-binding protein ZinT
MKICRVGAELFHADRRTDITKVIVAFRNFANVPKKAERFHIFTLVDNMKAIFNTHVELF